VAGDTDHPRRDGIQGQSAAVELAETEPDGNWRSRHFRGLDATVPLAALVVELPAAKIYLGVG
jgi:hypothetical protein